VTLTVTGGAGSGGTGQTSAPGAAPDPARFVAVVQRHDRPGRHPRRVVPLGRAGFGAQGPLAAGPDLQRPPRRRLDARQHHPTYRKLSRRQAASPRAILPGSQKPVPSVDVVVDTSGSMDDGLLAQAVGEVDGVLQTLGNSVGNVQVYSCAAAHTAGSVRRAHDLQLVGGGGTDLRVGIDAALSGRPRPELLIVLTDGDTPWPVSRPTGCAVVAVIISRGATPSCPDWAVRVDCCVA
jgi:hypothetical protein